MKREQKLSPSNKNDPLYKKIPKMYLKILDQINEMNLSDLSDHKLKNLSRSLQTDAIKGKNLYDLLIPAFALVREASTRVSGMRHFDVQLLAGLGLHEGLIIDMKTGEGKTLAAVCPAYLNALTGKGVHILTFNDYLAKRDAEWMGPVFEFLGLTAGYIQEGMDWKEKKTAYCKDITYATAKEAGFDHLRSFTASNPQQLVQRGFHYAIIDEVDSILLDEAGIPMVLAGNVPDESIRDEQFIDSVIKELTRDIHYQTDEYARNIMLTEEGTEYVEKMLDCENLYDQKNWYLLAGVNNALHANGLLKRDIDYIVRGGKIELVDEFTGRIADNRQWPDGLQAAIEAKEGIQDQPNGRILYSMTMKDYIVNYQKVSGMTGTASTAKTQFLDFYGLDVLEIPTNMPCIRIDYPDKIFTHKDAKFKALTEEISKVHKTGQPILIGTASVQESERLAKDLYNAGIPCNVLNAKNDELEAGIIAKAGLSFAVTVSTNMAGRGTDIKLGREEGIDREKIKSLGGLYVIGTNRHESIRIDNQLKGRAGRQGDPGVSCFFTSLEDNLMVRYQLKELIPVRFYPEKQDAPLEHKIIVKRVRNAQRIIEGQNHDIRRTLYRYTFILDQQRRMMYTKRMKILFGWSPGLLKSKLPELYKKYSSFIPEHVLEEAERMIWLYHINHCWMDYLSYINYIRNGIHLTNMAGKTPLDEFHKMAIQAYDELVQDIESGVCNSLQTINLTEKGIDLKKEGLIGPSSTWTYLVDDRPEQLGINMLLANPAFLSMNILLYMALAAYEFFTRKSRMMANNRRKTF